MKNIIKYAVHKISHQTIFISDALNGLSCNCICAECGGTLEAIQGEEYEWHFRHYIKSNCRGGQEKLIHKLAKKILCENTEILIPGELLNYSQARKEEPFESIVPDVTVAANGSTVFFEVYVTNRASKSKESFYRNGKHKSIEIDLSDEYYLIEEEALKKIILEKLTNKRKIYWPPVFTTANEFFEEKSPWWENPLTLLLVILSCILIFNKGYKWLKKGLR